MKQVPSGRATLPQPEPRAPSRSSVPGAVVAMTRGAGGRAASAARVAVPASCSRSVGSCCIATRGAAGLEVVGPAVARRSAFSCGAAVSQTRLLSQE
eukprot:scaffold18475_cov51-Phaeocystis_antarctica.AAC.2